jgi:lantibiotic modifying enzyme
LGVEEICQPESRLTPLIGLYVGDAGIVAALLSAYTALADESILEAAHVVYLRSDMVLMRSSDLYNGIAGRLRLAIHLWRAGKDSRILASIENLCRQLLDNIETTGEGQIFWPAPDPDSTAANHRSLSPKFLGYSHGLAGIADALLDYVELQEELDGSGCACVAEEVVTRVATQLMISTHYADFGEKRAARWPRHHDGPPSPSFWCHGGAGISLFLARLCKRGASDAVKLLPLLEGVRQAISVDVEGLLPIQCHGLAGNIEAAVNLHPFVSKGPEVPFMIANAFDAWFGMCTDCLIQTFKASAWDFAGGLPGLLSTCSRLAAQRKFSVSLGPYDRSLMAVRSR